MQSGISNNVGGVYIRPFLKQCLQEVEPLKGDVAVARVWLYLNSIEPSVFGGVDQWRLLNIVDRIHIGSGIDK